MKESTLRNFFDGEIPARDLAKEIQNSRKNISHDTTSHFVERQENGEFEIQKEHLILLCEEFLNGYLSGSDLNSIAFILMCSDFFWWDPDTETGEIIGQVVWDWDNEIIGHDINEKNVQLWKQFLESGEYRLDKEELIQKFRSKGKNLRLYQEIDAILWNDWDPIGINHVAPRDEYEYYTPIIFKIKLKGAEEEEIAAKLHEIETEVIGVDGNIDHCREVAQKILRLST